MKKNGILLALALAFTMNAQAVQKVIYGDDNRRDVYEVTNPIFLQMARSTAALIEHRNISKEGDNFRINGRSIGTSMNLCMDEPFRDQIRAANCSGFLVSENILVTAGHCVKGRFSPTADCAKYKYVFDYKVENQGQTEHLIPSENVFTCKRVVKAVLEGNGMDYAVIELDRPVVGRQPMSFRRSGKIQTGEELVVIGHPSGLPSKIADGAFVRRNDSPIFFSANLDTYGGNSGSAVFNVTTGEIEGILVRGAQDYTRDSSNNCTRSNICPMDGSRAGCRFEDVTRITNVTEIQNL